MLMMFHRALKAGKSDLIRIMTEEQGFITSDILSFQNWLSMPYKEKLNTHTHREMAYWFMYFVVALL